MVSTYRRSGPPTCFSLLLGIFTVIACYLIYAGGIRWADQQMNPGKGATAQAQQMETQAAIPTRPPFLLGPTRTPVPVCQTYYIYSETGTMRKCPDFQCEPITTLHYEDQVCVYSRADNSDEYQTGEEWYVVDQNPEGAFRDLAYIHHSVLKPRYPTPRPSLTFTPLPTITPTPTRTAPPTLPSLTPVPTDPVSAPTSTITPQPTPTTYRPNF